MAKATLALGCLFHRSSIAERSGAAMRPEEIARFEEARQADGTAENDQGQIQRFSLILKFD